MDDLTQLPEKLILARMGRHLQARTEHPIGSMLWAQAVTGYADCKAELDRRLVEHIREAAGKISRELPDGDGS